jgi:dTDP-glucose pyrophosphorylase
MINLIPMAGAGSRFFRQSYRVPKPFVSVMGKPAFLAAVDSFPKADSYIFLCLKEHISKYNLKENIAKHYPFYNIISIDQVTEGQACTCLLAEPFFNKNEGLFIASCDYQMIYDEQKYQALLEDSSIDVIIWTFRIGALKMANPNAFAYCKRKGNQVIEVVEKRTISDDPYNDPAVVGSFSYRTCNLFTQGAKKMIKKNIRVNNEFYVGTSINQLIEAGAKVVTFDIDKFISFGDPFELASLQYWEDYFDSLEDHPYKITYGHGERR